MITQAQRDAYRYALEDRGVPEVIAFMAAQNLNIEMPVEQWFSSARGDVISGAFPWSCTPQGHDFWSAVNYELEALA
jgi:hypothetical protein